MSDQYPWFKLRHRLKEIPTFLLAMFAGGEQRARLVQIIHRRQEARAQIEGRHSDQTTGVHLHRD